MQKGLDRNPFLFYSLRMAKTNQNTFPSDPEEYEEMQSFLQNGGNAVFAAEDDSTRDEFEYRMNQAMMERREDF